MFIKVLREAGYDEALMGLSLSFYDHKIPLINWEDFLILIPEEEEDKDTFFWTDEKLKRAEKRARALAFKGGGHNKFLESIVVWLYIQAPRSFWSEFDTYRTGMTKNSSSTMHTLDKRSVDFDDFEDGTTLESIEAFNKSLDNYKNPLLESTYKNITLLKNNLPEGWLQERQICTNYMTLQNIVRQREGHRLKYWEAFFNALQKQLRCPNLVFKPS
jgi:hypothetical protein